jgi:DNA-binding SARP family transcriptional activator
MEIRLLGPVELLSARGPVPIGSARQRALLALLALHPHRLMTYDVLIDGLWGGQPPDEAVKALRVHVSRLRGILRQACADDALRSRPGGYMLVVADDAVDALRFERAVAAARTARAAGTAPDTVSRMLRDALDLWAGPALADIDGALRLMGERGRLDELRLSATEDYLAAELAVGRHSDAVGELEQLIDRNPLRERLWELLITALYRSGRQADALAAYQRLRRTLVDELGIAPSASLRDLELKVLLQHAALAVPATGAPPVDRSVAADTRPSTDDVGVAPTTAVVRPRRGLATTALVLGLVALGLLWLGVVSTAIGVAAVACGAVAARRATRADASVRPLAVAGVLTGAVACAASLGLIRYRDVTGDDTVAVAPAPAEQDAEDAPAEGQEVSISTLIVGDCIDLLPGTAAADPAGGVADGPASVLLVRCEQPHEQEVYHLFELDEGPYPGDQRAQELSSAQCSVQFEEYVGTAPAASALDFIYVWPTQTAWNVGVREGGCVLFDAVGSDLTGSMAGSGR